MAKQFATAVTGTLKANVAIDENGNIAQNGDVVAGNKSYSINGLKAAASVAEANTVYNAIIGNIAGGTFDSDTFVKTISVGVVDVEEG